ncbi:MAG: hypothetical protein ABW360_15625 [Phenylobacterium sp.]
MTDQGPHHPTNIPDTPDKPEPRRATRNVPPLVWIILVLLVGAFAYALFQRGGTHTTPQGQETPQVDQATTVMPAAPATGDAPATPANVGDGDSSVPVTKAP